MCIRHVLGAKKVASENIISEIYIFRKRYLNETYKQYNFDHGSPDNIMLVTKCEKDGIAIYDSKDRSFSQTTKKLAHLLLDELLIILLSNSQQMKTE